MDNTSIPLIGYPGPGFHTLHITAMTSISISVLASFSVVCYMFRRNGLPFYKWHVGERIVIYLSLIDIGWGINHGTDHAIIYATHQHPVHELCVVFGFAFQFFMTSQSLLVMSAACIAFFLMVKLKQVDLGYKDWKLIALCNVPPILLGIVFSVLGYFGQNEAW